MIVKHELKWSNDIAFYNIVRDGCSSFFLAVMFLSLADAPGKIIGRTCAHRILCLLVSWTAFGSRFNCHLLRDNNPERTKPKLNQSVINAGKKYNRCTTAWLLLALVMSHLLSIYMWSVAEIMPAYHGHTFPKDSQAVIGLVNSVARNLSQDLCHTMLGGDQQ